MATIIVNVADVIYLVLGIVVVVGTGYGAVKLGKGTSVRTIAETAAADVARMKDVNDVLVAENTQLKAQVADLQSQLEALRLVVTGAAKIDVLRKETAEHHEVVTRGLDEIKELVRGR